MRLSKVTASLLTLIHDATDVISNLGLKLNDMALMAVWLAVRDLGCTSSHTVQAVWGLGQGRDC